MPTVIKSEAFAEWIDNLRDRAGAAQVLRRLARLERGNPGRVAPVGEGVSELKIDSDLAIVSTTANAERNW